MDTYTMSMAPESPDLHTHITGDRDDNFHNHSFFEIFYILNGEATHEWRDGYKNGKEELSTGDAFLLCPGVIHRFIRTKDEPCEHRDLVIRSSLMHTACEFIEPNFFGNIFNEKIIRFRLEDVDIAHLEKMIHTLLSDVNPDNKKKQYEKILLIEILSYIYMKSGDSNNISGFKRKTMNAVNKNYVKPDAINLIRSELGYNKIYFSRKFKAEFGEILTEYVLSLRLNYAAYLLMTTSCSLEECCNRSGIESVTYFINAFKKKFGTTPGKYRHANSKTNPVR